MQNTTLYTAGSNGTTTGNGEYVLYRHQERLVRITLRIRNPGIYSIHQLKDLVAPLAGRIFQSLQSGTLNNRGVIARELVLVQQLTDFHVYQLEQLLIINHIALVHEYYDIRYAYLTGKQDVLLRLSHNTIGSSYNQDSAVHLSSTSDHVLYIVSMTRAVNVSIMSLAGLILNVSGRDGNSTFSLFRSLIDVVESYCLAQTKSVMQGLGNRCSQGGFAMVYVTDGTNITMWFGSFELSFCHFKCPP